MVEWGMDIKGINNLLSEYMENNGLGCYVSLRENGEIQFDGYFDPKHFNEIIKLLTNNGYLANG